MPCKSVRWRIVVIEISWFLTETGWWSQSAMMVYGSACCLSIERVHNPAYDVLKNMSAYYGR